MSRPNAISKRDYDRIKNERVTVIRFDSDGKRRMTYGGVSYKTAVEDVMEATTCGMTSIILTKAQIVNKHIDTTNWELSYYQEAIQRKPWINQDDIAFREFAPKEETYYIMDCKYVRGKEVWILQPNYYNESEGRDNLIAVDNQYKIVATGLNKDNYYDRVDQAMNEYWEQNVR